MPTHATNGHAGPGAASGDELAVAAERAPDASERATSSVLALDGWGRLEPEPHINGAAPSPTQAEPAAAELLAEPPPTSLTKQNFERHLEPLPNSPPWRDQPAEADTPPGEQASEQVGAQAGEQMRVADQAGAQAGEQTRVAAQPGKQAGAQAGEQMRVADQPGEQAGAQVLRLGRLEIEAGPGLRLFASALVFGLAAGALVGAALRWLELRTTPPPPPPPPDDLLSRLQRAREAFSTPNAPPNNRARRRRQSQ